MRFGLMVDFRESELEYILKDFNSKRMLDDIVIYVSPVLNRFELRFYYYTMDQVLEMSPAEQMTKESFYLFEIESNIIFDEFIQENKIEEFIQENKIEEFKTLSDLDEDQRFLFFEYLRNEIKNQICDSLEHGSRIEFNRGVYEITINE